MLLTGVPKEQFQCHQFKELYKKLCSFYFETSSLILSLFHAKNHQFLLMFIIYIKLNTA